VTQAELIDEKKTEGEKSRVTVPLNQLLISIKSGSIRFESTT
jgi:hypothetical protein